MIEKSIPIDEIVNRSNRGYGGDGDIKILAEDIQHNGLINPVTVKPQLPAPGFVITAGRRRLAAARMLGWQEIPCRILEGDEAEHADDIALSENVNRLAMHPLDEAEIFRRLLEAGEPIQNIAKRYDRPASGIWQRVQLLDLSSDIKEMFRAGKLDLQSAAMLKSLDEKEQAEFAKAKKNHDGLSAWAVSGFVRGLHNDEVYKFLGKDCGKCKTRTFYTDQSLFPEAGIDRDSCLDRGCYVKKWTGLLEAGVKSLKGEHTSHAAASLLVFDYSANLQKILGKSVKLGGADYKIAERGWSAFSETASAGAAPCIHVSADGAELRVKPAWWKTGKEKTASLKEFSAELKLLGLPKDEDAAARAALKARKTDHFNFTLKVRQEVLCRLIAARAADQASSRGDAGLVLGNALRSPSARAKKIFSLFTGKEYAGGSDIKEVLKMGDPAAFALLYALSLSEHDIPPVYAGEGGKEAPAAFAWSGLPPDEIKGLYREAIRELLPKPKAGKKAKPGNRLTSAHDKMKTGGQG